MRKTATILLALCLGLFSAGAQDQTKKKSSIDLEKEFFQLPDSVTNEYLDATAIPKASRINDYWIVGVHGGVSVEHGFFNPPRQVSFYVNKPVYGFSVTRYATMMNTFPIVGMEFGFQHNYEGYNFKEFKSEGHVYRQTIDGAYEAYMEVPEVFLLTHAHLDMGTFAKILIKAGMYGGTEHSFLDTDYRWTYGVQGGLGLGFMVDPFEIHLGVQIKWGWSSFYHPDVASPYYYRFAYPLDGAVTLGLYYQLTPRRGHTRAQLRKMARQMVAEEREAQQQQQQK